MVVALPRSGTTWAANWLTTADYICIHDPMNQTHYKDWDGDLAARADRGLGVACTGVRHFPAWLNRHPARKVILHRPIEEVAASLARLGLPSPGPQAAAALDQIEGLHAPWSDIFEPSRAEAIWTHLLDTPFDAARHQLLRGIEMQPNFSGLKIGAEVTRRVVADVKRALTEAPAWP